MSGYTLADLQDLDERCREIADDELGFEVPEVIYHLVAPEEGSEKTYALLVRAMEQSGLAGIGKFVMRNRQYLGCLRVRGKALTLEQMHSPTRSTRRTASSSIVCRACPAVNSRWRLT